MRVLHVVQSLDPAWGGIARVVPQLAEGLVRLGVASRIATLAGGRYGQAPSVPGVEVLTFPARQGTFAASAEFDRAIPRLVAESDLVHVHGLWQPQNWTTGRAVRALRKPYVITPHSMMMPWAWKRHWWKKRPAGWLYEHRNLREADRLHALAPGEADAMRRLDFNSRIEVIPNGIWPSEFERLPEPADLLAAHPELAGKRCMLFLSRLALQKGLAPLMQAAHDVGAVHPDWHLVLAGPVSDRFRRVIVAALNRKGMNHHVTITGMLDRPRVLQALALGQLLVQPSLSEGLSVSLLEGMAAGLPLVISPQCNLPEVEPLGAGRVVAPERRAIASVLRDLLARSPEELRAMGTRGRALVRREYDWNSLLPRYVRLYEDVRAGRERSVA